MARSKCGSFTKGKGWRKRIGNKISLDGRLLPMRFWLGMDERRATVAALQIESLWIQLQCPYWSTEALAEAERIRVGASQREGKNAPESKQMQTVKMPMVKMPMTVKMGIERYRTTQLNNPSLSPPSKQSLKCRTKMLEQSPIAKMPLTEVGAEQLAELVAYWLRRPVNSKGNQISQYSSRFIVKTARMVFDWLDAMGMWEAPRRFERIFRLPRDGGKPRVEVLTMDELQSLWRNADDRMRLLLCLALNCGFCSMELATLKRNEIDLSKGIIKRERQKTLVETEWQLWSETVKLLKKHISCQNDDDLALLNNKGKPLVFYSDNWKREDSIGHYWRRLRVKANVSKPFKAMRKTGATMIRSIGGIEVSEQYLAHSDKGMARHYSKAEPQRLVDALAKLRKHLKPMFCVRASQGE